MLAEHPVDQRSQQAAADHAGLEPVLGVERTDTPLTLAKAAPGRAAQCRQARVVVMVHPGRTQRADDRAGVEHSDHQVGLLTRAVVASDTDLRIEAADASDHRPLQEQRDRTGIPAAKGAEGLRRQRPCGRIVRNRLRDRLDPASDPAVDLRMHTGRLDHPRQAVRLVPAVVIGKRDPVAPCGLDALVAGRRQVRHRRTQMKQRHALGPDRLEHRCDPIVRILVDDDQFEIAAGLRQQRCKHRSEHVGTPVGRKDQRELGHGRGRSMRRGWQHEQWLGNARKAVGTSRRNPSVPDPVPRP